MKIGILEPEFFSEDALNCLKKIGEVSLFDSEDKLKTFVLDKTVLFIRLKYFIGKELIENASSLKFICSPTTGLNHIDQNYIKQKGIKILSLKGEYEFLSNIRATPEHTFGLVLSLLRNYKMSFLNLGNKKWDRYKYWGQELFENNIGIIGFGRVGKLLAKYFKCFGANVFFYDIDTRIKSKDNSTRVNSIKRLIEVSNIILLCVSYSPENNEFFNKKYIDLLENKFFINTSRGELIDEDYLIKKIKENHFKGIALDVLTNETEMNNNLNNFVKLTEKRNFILTPHIAGLTLDSVHKTEDFIVRKLKEMI